MDDSSHKKKGLSKRIDLAKIDQTIIMYLFLNMK